MKEFFKVKPPEQVLALLGEFQPVGAEEIGLAEALGRVAAADIVAEADLPPFDRSTMDGYAVHAADTFGASESVPALLEVAGEIRMGEEAAFSLSRGQAAAIATGGMLCAGADAVVMVEHTQEVAANQIEVTRSVAPGQHVIRRGEDLEAGKVLLERGRSFRPQEVGLLAALGRTRLSIFRRPRVAIISTGDEIVPVEAPEVPPGRLRDVNSYSLAAQTEQEGAVPLRLGIVRDSFEELLASCRRGLETADMVIISGGSSVGTRDFTLGVIKSLAGRVLVHGVALSPGKPTILADAGGKPLWGLPGHVASAMLVFHTLVAPLIRHLRGRVQAGSSWRPRLMARLARNIASAMGREDWVRVRLGSDNGQLVAHPVLGKSGLISTMLAADGLIRIDLNSEGLDEGELVEVFAL